MLKKTLFVTLFSLIFFPTAVNAQMSLAEPQASHFARLALKCVAKEFPNKPEHVMNNRRDLQAPSELHPSFYGCYDWHSSVHGHWMLVRLLRMFPNLREADAIRQALDKNLTRENIQVETAYLKQANRQSFERTY